MISEELKPCPFCGGKAVKEFDSDWGLVVRCLECQAIMTESPCLGILKPVEAWNTRAERTCEIEQDYDAMDDGIPDCRIWKCSCGESFPFWRGLNPCFCPNCGAKVIDNEG